jgi:hypothetical protein
MDHRNRPRPAGRTSRARENAPRVHWSGFRPLFDFWGTEIKRFYKIETLAGATEWMIGKNDRFLAPSIQDVLGPAPVASLSFDLFQEGRYQLIFRLRAVNARRREATFAFVAAKKHEDFSALAQAEHRNLRILHERAPAYVVKPFRGGTIYLPDRHQRAGHGREIYAYVTEWLNGFHELGVNRDLQFFVNIAKPHTFTIAQTEALKQRIVEIVARTYHPGRRECMEIPQIASGDFVVTNTPRGVARLKLIACRHLLTRVSPEDLIHRVAAASWEWGGRRFRLAPADPSAVFDAFAGAVGRATARAWFTQYHAAVSRRVLPEQDTLPIGDLELIVRS